MLSKMMNSFYNKIVLLYNNCHYVDQYIELPKYKFKNCVQRG